MHWKTTEGNGSEYGYPQYETVVSADGDSNGHGREHYDLMFGLSGDTAEILLCGYNNHVIDNPTQLSRGKRNKVVSFIKDEYDVENVRFSN